MAAEVAMMTEQRTDRVPQILDVAVIDADATGQTAVPGVWVAGNVANVQAQVVTAAAGGVAAGAAVNADLIAEETRQAVAAYRAMQPAAAEHAVRRAS
jgi:thioredoxin reductase